MTIDERQSLYQQMKRTASLVAEAYVTCSCVVIVATD